MTVEVPVRNERAMRFHELAGFKREMKTLKTTALGTVKIDGEPTSVTVAGGKVLAARARRGRG